MTPAQTWLAVGAILGLALLLGYLLCFVLKLHRKSDRWGTPVSKWQPPKQRWWHRHELKINFAMLAVAVAMAGVLGPTVDKHSEAAEVAQR